MQIMLCKKSENHRKDLPCRQGRMMKTYLIINDLNVCFT